MSTISIWLTIGRRENRKIIGIGREVLGQRRDGSTFPMDLSVGEAREGGESIFVGIIHDLTERKQSEQFIRESAMRLRAVVDTAVDGVILINATGTIEMFNPACEKLFGYSQQEVAGQNVRVLMPSPFHEEHDQYLTNYRETGVKRIIGIGREVTGRRKDGSVFPMELSVGEAQQHGEVVFVGIIHDLTDRKRTEEQLVQAQKMETVGQLSGGIAHDFNNLLTVIIGHSELLAERLRARPDLKHYCDTVINAAERGADLTRRLLAFSRKQTLQPAAINANELIESMKIILRRTLREDIEIVTLFEENPIMAFADPTQLESAILNLALNAQDAMPDGGTLHITTSNAVLDSRYQDSHLEVMPGAYVLIAVTDNGTGMPADVAERAFEPFFTTKEVGKGSGLGLSMVYGFVKQSNGHVAIYSEPGLGTSVKLYLPASSSVRSAQASGDSEIDPPTGSGTVLVVEDDPFVRGYAVGCVEALGYRVITAANGPEALAKLTSHKEEIDLMFSDVVMPGGIGGHELAERARIIKPGLRVLLTSGYQMEMIARQGANLSNIQILNKPYRKAELGRRLRSLLDGM